MSAVEHADNEKLREFKERCAAEGIAFVPFALDTLSGWHPSALSIIVKIGRQVTSRWRRWFDTSAKG